MIEKIINIAKLILFCLFNIIFWKSVNEIVKATDLLTVIKYFAVYIIALIQTIIFMKME